jgi:hypothetical protein
VALKKPSEYFKKDVPSVDNSIREAAKSPELNTFSDAFQSFKNNLSKIEVLSDFSETLDNYRVNVERVNHLSASIEDVKTEIQTLLKKEDLDRAMMSQLLVVEQSILDVQNKVKGINEKNLTEIRLDVSGLTENVNEFLEIEVPKYKKLIVDTELRTNARYEELEENVNQTLEGIGEFVENKYQELTETLEGINEKSLSSILEEFETLENSFQKLVNEDIPKYKGFIVETERKVDTKFDEKISQFDESVGLKISTLNQKILDFENQIEQIENQSDSKYSQLLEQFKDKLKEFRVLSESVKADEQFQEELTDKVTNLHLEIVRNETHIKVQNKTLKAIQEEVKDTLSKINLEEFEEKSHKLNEKIKYLEEVFEKFSEKEILTESLLAEPSSTNNQDPLTPLDKNFVTLEQLQEHYRLFINRIQQQLATIGGGGETRFEFLDDIDRNSVKQDGYVIQYNSATGKFIGTSYVPGGGGNVAIAITNIAPSNPDPGNLWYDFDIGRTFLYYTDEDGSQWVDANPAGTSSVGESYWASTSAGIHTLSNIGIGTINPTSKLTVSGDVNVTGVVTASSFSGNASSATYATTAGIATYATTAGVSTYAGTAGIATNLTATSSVNTTGIITASAFVGDGSGLTGIIASGGSSQWITTSAGIHTLSKVGIGTTNPTSALTIQGNALVSGFTSVTDTRLNSVSEESVIGIGNTVSLVYNTGGGNIGIITSPSGPITLSVTGIPTDSTFDNRTLTFSVMVNQGVTGYACSTVTLNGVSATVKYPGAVVSTGATNAYDIFNFTCINPVGSASTTSNYVVLGMVNGNFK